MIKDEIENNTYILKYLGDLRGSKWTEEFITLRNGCEIKAIGAGAKIRGRRPDLIILDDIETDETVLSKDQTDKLRNWINKGCIPTLVPDGQFLWVGTLISFSALIYEYIHSNNDIWDRRIYAAYKSDNHIEGNELWPEQWPHSRLKQRKSLIGSLAFASEYLNCPMANETAPIKPSQIRRWKDLPTNLSMVMTFDPAYTDDSNSDWKIGYLVGMDEIGRRFTVTYVRTHAPLGDYIDQCLNLYERYKDNIFAVGCPKGREIDFWNRVVEKSEARNIHLPLIETKNSFTRTDGVNFRQKKARIIASLQPLFEQGKYWIHEAHNEFEDELLMLGAAKHDDLVDAACYAEQILNVNGYVVPIQTVGRYGEMLPEEKGDDWQDSYWDT